MYSNIFYMFYSLGLNWHQTKRDFRNSLYWFVIPFKQMTVTSTGCFRSSSLLFGERTFLPFSVLVAWQLDVHKFQSAAP